MRIFKRSDWQPAGKGRGRHFLSCKLGVALSVALFAMGTLVVPTAQAAVPTPAQDPFYSYQGSTPLKSVAPGTVLKTRTLSYHVLGVPLPVSVVQLLYRSTGMLGQPTVNVTSVLEPPIRFGTPKVVSYQSFYDSLSPDDEPSYQISGGLTLGRPDPRPSSRCSRPGPPRRVRRRRRRHRGRDSGLRRGTRVRDDTLDSLRAAVSRRQPASGHPADRHARLLRRGHRHGVGFGAGAHLRTERQQAARRRQLSAASS